MTPIDKKNELIVKSLVELQRLTADEAKKIALLIAKEMLNEVEILRIEDMEYRMFILRYWKNVIKELEKL
jgi:hypothetical protein